MNNYALAIYITGRKAHYSSLSCGSQLPVAGGGVAHLDDLFLRRQRVDDFDEACFLREDADSVAFVAPPRAPEVVGPVCAGVGRGDVDESAVGRVRDDAVGQRVDVRPNLDEQGTGGAYRTRWRHLYLHGGSWCTLRVSEMTSLYYYIYIYYNVVVCERCDVPTSHLARICHGHAVPCNGVATTMEHS